ncbi:MAG: cation diffusion facilitator family transporter [Deltaproteobacteria bacterium]|nr:cation diffusion facilitator family transporter [Deltaproteobacteria bacterium]
MSGNPMERLQQGQKVALVASLLIFSLAVGKYLIGFMADSRILIADAVHSSVDLVAILASWLGLWLASAEKSKKFPYGLYRAETFVTLVIGVLISLAGLDNLYEGYQKLFLTPVLKSFPVLPIVITVISLAVAYFIAKKEKETGKEINSRALLANASESFLDIGTALVVLAGLLLTHARILYVEGAVVMLIALLIFRIGLENVWTSLLILMDANLDPQMQQEIENKIINLKGVRGVKGVKIRQVGPFKMVDCVLTTSPSLTVFKAHELADQVEELVMKTYDGIESVFVHIEPSKQKGRSVIIPVGDINDLDSRVYGHFGRAPYFIILKLDNNGLEIEDFYYNEFFKEKDRIHVGIKVINAVIKHNLDIVFTPRIGEIAFYMLKDHFVDIYRAEEGSTVREIIEKFRNDQIEPITAPHPAEESEIGRKNQSMQSGKIEINGSALASVKI